MFERRRRGSRLCALLLVLLCWSCGRELHPELLPDAARIPKAESVKGIAEATPPPIEPITAPFPMPDLQRPRFPQARFDVTKFGAVADGKTKNTEAFRRAIAAAKQRGGGRVVVPAGRYLTGPIHLESNIELHVTEGAELLFSQDFADYLPPVFTRWEGMELYNYSPLIYAHDCSNVGVTGRGKLNGQGQAWWPWKQTQHASAARLYALASSGVPAKERVVAVEGGLRPSFIQTVNCRNVLVEGLTISDGPMWTIHPVYSENVIVRDVRVITHGPNNDGCNPDSSRNVLIEDSLFSTGDDCVVIKSGLNEDGWRVARPSENIVVRRLRGERGHGGVVIGSEMSGGVRNVYVHDSEFIGTDRGLRIKSMRGRGGVVENIFYEKVRHRKLRLMVVELTTFYASSTLQPKTQAPPLIRNVHIRDIIAHGAKQALEIVGLPEVPIENVSVERAHIESETGARCVDCKDVQFSDVSIVTTAGTPFTLEHAQNLTLTRSCPTPLADCVTWAGAESQAITSDGQALRAKARR